MIINIQQDLDSLNKDLKNLILKDRTTNKNIINTDCFKEYGSIPCLIPRCLRNKELNLSRTRNSAEVYTPIRIVKEMNDLVMKEYNNEEHSFEDYIDCTQLEITCGEGVFLTTRYDSETGEIVELESRVGLLDRKLQRLCIEIKERSLFLDYMLRIAKSMYGYEYQGDSLIIARLNVFYSFLDFYYSVFKENIDDTYLESLMEIITYNIFQMDGLTWCIPQKDVKKDKHKEYIAIDGIPVKVYNWKENRFGLFKPV